MPTGAIVRPNDYHDSVFLMRAAGRITAQPGITQASAVMGSEQNKRLLAESGLDAEGIDAAGPNDLILAVKGAKPGSGRGGAGPGGRVAAAGGSRAQGFRRADPDQAIERQPQANLAVILLPGEYAGREARQRWKTA